MGERELPRTKSSEGFGGITNDDTSSLATIIDI